MKKPFISFKHAGLGLVAVLSCAAAQAQMSVTSTSFANGGLIPTANTYNMAPQCSGGNLSPQLSITGIPAGTQRLAIEMRDTTVPWLHWKVWDIPVAGTSVTLAEGGSTAYNATSSNNDFATPGYGGPCPPTATPHNYVFTVYALTTAVGSGEPSATDLGTVPAASRATLTGVRAINSSSPGTGVAAVPTMSEMGIVLTGLLLAGGAAARLRRHRKA